MTFELQSNVWTKTRGQIRKFWRSSSSWRNKIQIWLGLIGSNFPLDLFLNRRLSEFFVFVRFCISNRKTNSNRIIWLNQSSRRLICLVSATADFYLTWICFTVFSFQHFLALWLMILCRHHKISGSNPATTAFKLFVWTLFQTKTQIKTFVIAKLFFF